MRVVSGTAKGRRLQAPGGLGVRPTSDRVREAIFDVLGSLGGVADMKVADLFAGTGALGIEALSRGAARATLVDRDKTAADTMKINLVTTGLYARAVVVQADVLSWLRLNPDASFDIVFADPPYDFDAWPELLAGLRTGLAILESDREIDLGDAFEVVKIKRYGGTVVTIAQSTSRTDEKGPV
ncbi:MAG TPA: 16S rRNA (guanine(966)-N(2))-methyltransferase RsmD [Acidimicrobiales bacterium]|nr:16S rRNA (guanine(966)-N(2))-methyltransferase RsmD [Acidimicrobiales bacterium]